MDYRPRWAHPLGVLPKPRSAAFTPPQRKNPCQCGIVPCTNRLAFQVFDFAQSALNLRALWLSSILALPPLPSATLAAPADGPPPAPATTNAPPSLRGTAGWLDLGAFMDQAYGFVTRTRTIVTGGTGFRYELARKYGLHMGADVGFGPDGPVLYIQFGSAWMRP